VISEKIMCELQESFCKRIVQYRKGIFKMKKYEKPVMDIIELEMVDVLTDSLNSDDTETENNTVNSKPAGISDGGDGAF
jgi:hypothetical protein